MTALESKLARLEMVSRECGMLNEHDCIRLLQACRVMAGSLKHGVKYLESCGLNAQDHEGEPEYQMLKDFQRSLAKAEETLK